MGKKRRKQKRSNTSNKNQQNRRTHENSVTENDLSDNQESCSVASGTENESTVNVVEMPKKTNQPTKSLSNIYSPVGLSNLGNTCFFNSIMQNLIETPVLHQLLKDEILLSNKESVTIHPNDGHTPPLSYIPAGLGELATALSCFFDSVKSMQQPTEGNSNKRAARNKIFSPRTLFNKICAKNERFRGYQQQDSQELYHCLLDGVKTEEIKIQLSVSGVRVKLIETKKRKKRGILKALHLNKPSAEEISDDMRQRVKAYGRVIMEKEDTIIERVFGGTLISSVLCDECSTVTGVVEPFHDISLPIVEDKISKSIRKGKHAKEEKDEVSDADDNSTIPKPMSKTALKKAKRAADKAARRKERNAKRESEKVEKAFGNLASSLVDEAISMALRSLALDDEFLDSEEQEPIEPNEDDMDNDALEPKLKGGALAVQALNLPTDEQLAQQLESKLKIDNDESEKHNNETKKILEDGQESEKVTDFETGEAAESEIEKSDKIPDMNNEESVHVSDAQIEEAEGNNGVTKETQTADESQANEESPIDGVDPPEKEKSSDRDESSEEENGNRSPMFNKREISLFDTPKRPEPTYTCLPSGNKLPETLASREELSQRSKECTLQSCFFQFTMPEILTDSNKFGCEVCTKRQHSSGDSEKKTVYCNASKQILIQVPPEVLTIHLKRFQQVGCSLRKVNKYVNLPTVLDISPFCIQSCKKYADEDMKIVYGLYGMVEHSGSLSRGHYTAYVRLRDSEDPDPDFGFWYHISDCKVTKVSAAKALKCNAYLLFYERLSRTPVR